MTKVRFAIISDTYGYFVPGNHDLYIEQNYFYAIDNLKKAFPDKRVIASRCIKREGY